MKIGPRTAILGKRSLGAVRRVFFTLGALILYLRDELVRDVQDIVLQGRLFLGIALVVVGALSFASDKYCDGNATTYYTCTRPETYYYYPWWAVVLIVVGISFIVLWFLRRRNA